MKEKWPKELADISDFDKILIIKGFREDQVI